MERKREIESASWVLWCVGVVRHADFFVSQKKLNFLKLVRDFRLIYQVGGNKNENKFGKSVND